MVRIWVEFDRKMVYGNQGVIKGKNRAFPEDVKLFATFSATSFALMCYFKTNVKFSCFIKKSIPFKKYDNKKPIMPTIIKIINIYTLLFLFISSDPLIFELFSLLFLNPRRLVVQIHQKHPLHLHILAD